MIIKRNWGDAHPTIAHQSGLDWRFLSWSAIKTSGDIEESALDPQCHCLKAITYVSFANLQPRLSYEPHHHEDHEEVYYIINGTGRIKIWNADK
jgi:mannose-6-phosphate isomerase-like protein (cupin superfamily)